MRAGLSTVQQTLTPEAASVLNQSIAEAARRNHGQTTPLHVASTLLASPAGFLRQACIRSHPNSSHPLQCRALELCFSVALERLPTAAAPAAEPPISNALMAALKRAQAHQRRGCPEQQQQPLLAVKVELEQLIISILDDPSVSRVMREASFSSPAVKATIEQSLNNSSNSPLPTNVSPVGLGFRPVSTPASATRNLYLNPKLQQHASLPSGQQRSVEVRRVMDILGRKKRRNPVLVGDSEPGRVVGEILKKVEDGEFEKLPARNVKVIHLDELNTDKAARMKELSELLEVQIGNSDPTAGGVVLDLGDLKWLVDQQHIILGATQSSPNAAEMGRTAVAELRKLLEKFEGRLWFIGTATCATYLRCQVYHPSMENDLDLQAVPMAPKTPPSGGLTRLGNGGVLGTSGDFIPLKSFPAANMQVYEKVDSARTTMKCCPQCLQSYEQEVSKLNILSSEAAQMKQLPHWLLNAKVDDVDPRPVDQSRVSVQELQKKWNDICLRLHSSYHHSLAASAYCSTLPLHQPLQPKLQPNRNLCEKICLSSSPVTSQAAEQAKNRPGSPVRTELMLGQPKVVEPSAVQVKDFLGCISSEAQTNKFNVSQGGTVENSLDIDLFKKLSKGLSEKIWWQHDAASAVAATVSQCKLGNGKKRGVSSKGDVWLLFSGPDRVGKKKMASTLSNLVYGTTPTTISLGSRRDDGDANFSCRGKTSLDSIVETVKRSPFSVIVLEDIDEADMLVRGSIKQAMERGRLLDTYGREISLGNVIFVLTASWASKNNNTSFSDDERRLCGLTSENWQLKLCLRERGGKRRPSWLNYEEERPRKPKKERGSGLGLRLDLNQAADGNEDKGDGSYNTSDLTCEHDQEDQGHSSKLSLQYVPFVFHELVSRVDDAVVFKAVDFGPIRRNISKSLSERFGQIMGDSLPLEIEDDALEKILGGVWLGQTGFEEWMEGTVVPGLNQLKSRLSARASEERTIVGLEMDENYGERSAGDLMPRSIKLVIE